MELLGVICTDSRAADPLAVDFAPCELRPTGVGLGHMYFVLLDALPISRGRYLTESGGEIVAHHLGHSARAGGEIEQSSIGDNGSLLGIGRALKLGRIAADNGAVIYCAVNGLVADGDIIFEIRALGQGVTDMLNNIVVAAGYEHFDARRIDAVDIVFLHQLERCGNNYRADFMQRGYDKPDFGALLQNEHDYVALLYSLFEQEVDSPVAVVFYIFESVARHIAGIVRPDEGELLGFDIRPRINNIETEVEIIGHIYFEILLHILIAVKVIAGTEALDYIIHFFFFLSGGVAVLFVDNGQESCSSVYRRLAVREVRIEVDSVALIEDKRILADRYLDLALKDEVELLAGVHNERGLGLLLFERDEHRLHLAVLEVKSKALDIIARISVNSNSVAASDDSVAVHSRGFAGHEHGAVRAECRRYGIERADGDIFFARLVFFIFIMGDIQLLRHFGYRYFKDLSQFLNSLGYL